LPQYDRLRALPSARLRTSWLFEQADQDHERRRVGKGALLRAVPTIFDVARVVVGTAHAFDLGEPAYRIRVRLCPPYR